jgi:hypothetical protein
MVTVGAILAGVAPTSSVPAAAVASTAVVAAGAVTATPARFFMKISERRSATALSMCAPPRAVLPSMARTSKRPRLKVLDGTIRDDQSGESPRVAGCSLCRSSIYCSLFVLRGGSGGSGTPELMIRGELMLRGELMT